MLRGIAVEPEQIAQAGGGADVVGRAFGAAVAKYLPQPVVVKVSDAFGNGVGGVTVTFSPAAGSVSPTTAQTSTAGAAQTMLYRPYPVSH